MSYDRIHSMNGFFAYLLIALDR